MFLFLPFLLLLFLLFLLTILLPLIRLLIRQRSSPLRHLPGPPCPSFFMGNLAQMHDQENNNLIHKWEAAYGSTFVYRGFIGGPRLMTTDPIAISHILEHAYEYPKPDFVRDSLASMSSGHDGLLTVEGDQHRRQRKILAPAFSTLHVKSLAPVFWDKATMLRDIWLQYADTADPDVPNSSRVDALSWLARATLDVIGEAGFGYYFNTLSPSSTSPHNELAAAFGVIFSTARKFRVMTILQVWFPILRRFRRNNVAKTHADATMRRIGMQLIEQKRAEILAEDANTQKSSRDLLTLLIRSNLELNTSLKQMSTQEVLCQISTFIAAGHETTASAMTWCLYALAQDQRVQGELRRALRTLVPEGEEGELTARIEGCTYLEWVVREVMRLHAPVTSTMRVCARPGGDIIPVSRPVGTRWQNGGATPEGSYEDAIKTEYPYPDVYGEKRWGVRVAEGDIVSIPIQAVNRCRQLWGPDAGEFRPERWEHPPTAARAVPGLFAHTLTFLNRNGSVSAGNRACIGWRFAVLEIKIFLYTLIKDLEFGIDKDMIIEKRVNVVTRPFVKSEPHLGNQMPLNIRRVPP